MDLLASASQALVELSDPLRLALLLAGVVIGLLVGLIPGIGGLTALAVLIPFTYALDPFSAMALLIGMWSVVPMSDVIPAVFFGVPGTVGCAATVLDGHPLARKGEAARALGASYAASTLGGLFGALLLAVSIPILRPLMLQVGTPELLGFCIFGLSMVAALSGRQPLRGLTVAAVGILIAMMGVDPQTGTERLTFGSIYLWDGLPLAPFTLGLFAIPELGALMIARSKITEEAGRNGFSLAGQLRGFGDVLRNWWLMIRCSWIGVALGAVPGMGASVIDWIAYGHASRTEKNSETFGTGDIRGVIASESSNNAREGGALVPTLAFGVPGSASMALLLAAFQVHGLVPGPQMLGKNLDVTYLIIASLVAGTIVGAVICVVASGYLVKIVNVRYAILLPIVLGLALIGAYVGGAHAWSDLAVLIGAGLLGWIMRELDWPRAPLLLGFVLGDLVEQYLFISVQLYGASWLLNPVVTVLLIISLYGVYRPMKRVVIGVYQAFRSGERSLRFNRQVALSLVFLALLLGVALVSSNWPARAQVGPQIVAWSGVVVAGLTLILEIFRSGMGIAQENAARMDTGGQSGSSEEGLSGAVVFRRGALYFTWLLGVALLAWLIGYLPALLLFTIAFVRFEGKEKWLTAVLVGAGLFVAVWLIFDVGLGVVWPRSVAGSVIPELRQALGGLI